MSLQKITNYLSVSDNVTSSGQPEDHEFKYIKAAGYEIVINLAMPNSENAISEEGNIVTAHGMTYVHIPVPWEAPTMEHLQQFSRILEIYDTLNGSGDICF